MSQHIDFQPGDTVVSNYGQYEVIDCKDGLLHLLPYEKMGYYFDAKKFTLIKRKPTQWKLESDGTLQGTKIWINNQLIAGIRGIKFEADIDHAPILELSLVPLK